MFVAKCSADLNANERPACVVRAGNAQCSAIALASKRSNAAIYVSHQVSRSDRISVKAQLILTERFEILCDIGIGYAFQRIG